MWKIGLFLGVLIIAAAYAAPQAPADQEKYEPYEYQYEVKDPEKMLFFDKNEIGDASGKVTGKYSVWLPDGRLMTVEYSVAKETGFVPKVTFQDNANPLQG
ncbi:pro-resilin-like [Sitodiplosis mosellana]|uniref:pro-resilin-like n=1 Tax=Sitodiplosis mosellana TaxID=263140 RepID=UPI0024447CF2|nr:pro-resilin-like [Sitodiplosis mosellana]